MAWRKSSAGMLFCVCVCFRLNVMSFVRAQNYSQTIGLQVVLQNILLLWWHHDNTAILFFEVPFKCHDMNVIIMYHSYTTVLEQHIEVLQKITITITIIEESTTVYFHDVCYEIPWYFLYKYNVLLCGQLLKSHFFAFLPNTQFFVFFKKYTL